MGLKILILIHGDEIKKRTDELLIKEIEAAMVASRCLKDVSEVVVRFKDDRSPVVNWASRRRIRLRKKPIPEYSKFKQMAETVQNFEIVDYCDLAVILWGRGRCNVNPECNSLDDVIDSPLDSTDQLLSLFTVATKKPMFLFETENHVKSEWIR